MTYISNKLQTFLNGSEEEEKGAAVAFTYAWIPAVANVPTQQA
jgi:hypothetical protein